MTRGQCDSVSFPATGRHLSLSGTKLYCPVTEVHVCRQLAPGCTRQRVSCDLNLLIASPAPEPLDHPVTGAKLATFDRNCRLSRKRHEIGPCLLPITSRKYLYLTLKALRYGSHSVTCKLHRTCLYLLSIHQMAHPRLRLRTSNCSLLLIYLPRKDERLSWPGWLVT